MDISEKIAAIRESKKIKQSEIASKLGIDQPNYSRLEKRGEKLTIEQLTQIANALGVSMGEILEIEEKQDNEKESLLKQIEVLEDRIKDKEQIIDSLHTKIEKHKLLLLNTTSFELIDQISELGLVTIRFYNTRNVKQVLAECSKTDKEKLKYYNHKFYFSRYHINTDDTEKIVEHVLSLQNYLYDYFEFYAKISYDEFNINDIENTIKKVIDYINNDMEFFVSHIAVHRKFF